MHCGVMVTGYNQGDWERLLAEDYSRPPAVSDAANMDDTLELGELVEPLGFDSIWATELAPTDRDERAVAYEPSTLNR
jgi:hypothetical protein